jgi:hypothetical protein
VQHAEHLWGRRGQEHDFPTVTALGLKSSLLSIVAFVFCALLTPAVNASPTALACAQWRTGFVDTLVLNVEKQVLIKWTYMGVNFSTIPLKITDDEILWDFNEYLPNNVDQAKPRNNNDIEPPVKGDAALDRKSLRLTVHSRGTGYYDCRVVVVRRQL